ncbi:MAG: hypothetical protein IPP51_18340 [Bacteroidetes bacterium]|nr:hypothetical protein [Bacteroidota bacterium]
MKRNENLEALVKYNIIHQTTDNHFPLAISFIRMLHTPFANIRRLPAVLTDMSIVLNLFLAENSVSVFLSY